MVTSTALAVPEHVKKKLVAPAMNTKMYDHPATQANLKNIRDLWLSDHLSKRISTSLWRSRQRRLS